MPKFISRVLAALSRLLYQRIVLVLVLLLCAGIGGTLWNMSRLSSNLIETQALQNAKLYAKTILEARTLYSNKVVARAQTVPGITVTHDYLLQEGAIPLPATFLIELGQRIEIHQSELQMAVRLYSDYPFPWRKVRGGPQDRFEREAIEFLRQHPHRPFTRIEKFQDRLAFRYAQADIMEPSCINCHNTHPDSPKRDWKVGDVRGILEITQPIESISTQTKAALRETFIILGALSVLGMVELTLTIGRLQQTSKDLERRVTERTAQLQQAYEELSAEQEKSERLLLNILPEPIAAELKQGNNNIAREFSEVTILFADIVGFTPMSQQISPEELVQFLNEIFSGFDRLTEQHGLEKIKTIGDAYMVAGGLPYVRTDHAEAVAEMALDMQQELARFNQKHNATLSIRVGINTGPVVAGVIGTKKFIYDMWGDAVNTASRMESHGLAGCIQVTEKTYQSLKNQYILEERGAIQVKGKGEMKTFLLVDRKSSYIDRHSG